ncbi:hypothetical protein Cgig2_020312 [Carnegiea gigantea]|uniref:Reverse transcriptase n=1 Tax=Carnegiea gigantea TaxID=171969 RepID=A0A9Q1JU17_9CARY|nr:hypothetical protein Cgig2_020312 [Carnegiea gigantea]
MENDSHIASRAFPIWKWENNSTPNIKGRIWIAWQPRLYEVLMLQKSYQILHCYATQVNTNKKFFITFRQSMWEDLLAFSHQMTEAWCILGDFNAVLYKDSGRGGNVIQVAKIREMANFIEQGDLHEMRWNWTYYSWTNKIVWSRADRALINIHWYEYLANGLSNHTPILVHFCTSSKPKGRFLFCETWCKHQEFNKIVDSVISPITANPLSQLRNVMAKLRSLLSKLNRDKYADLRAQQELARGELTKIQQQLQEDPVNSMLIQAKKGARGKYIHILSSCMTLMQQQCKLEWISYRDDNTKTFFAKAKQRKLASYICKIQDTKRDLVEGFNQMWQTMITFYKALLGEQNTTRHEIDMGIWKSKKLSSQSQTSSPQGLTALIVGSTKPHSKSWVHLYAQLPNLPLASDNALTSFKGTARLRTNLQKSQIITGLRDSSFPLKYLGVPITASRLIKIECASLVIETLKHGTGKENRIIKWPRDINGKGKPRENYAKTKWDELREWWRYTPAVQNNSQLLSELEKSKGPRTLKKITSSIIQATFYYIWSARNHKIFKKQHIIAYQTVYLIKD